jgi:hypothetical protein
VTRGSKAEARWRSAGSLLLREIRSLKHNLDKSMLTLAAHTESANAFLIKVGKRTGENAQSACKHKGSVPYDGQRGDRPPRGWPNTISMPSLLVFGDQDTNNLPQDEERQKKS